jgi:NAD+ synthetase
MKTYQLYDTEVEQDQWGSILRDETYDMLKLGLSDYINKNKFKSVVVGSSGGIDSALVLSLACDAIGPENVHGIRMPSTISSDHSKSDAAQLHKNLGCHDHLVPIDHGPFVDHILQSLRNDDPIRMPLVPKPIANENIQARLRGLVLMYYSNAFDALLLSTGNKTELALGYCTLYGDMNGGFCPINDLYKMQVYEMAKFFNRDGRTGTHLDRQRFDSLAHCRKPNLIPEHILTKAPSAELAPGQTDEASLLPYPILDAIVKAYVENFIADFKSFVEWTKSILMRDFEWVKSKDAEEQYKRMIRLININEFKRRQAAPGIKVTPVAFGIGRRLPIVKG